MKKRICSLVLCLVLLLTSASALTIEQAGQLLQDYYIDEIPAEILEQDSVDAMLRALGDPYTRYYTAEEYAAFLDSLEDTELVGIGIIAYYLDEGILINQVAPDSPAREVGLQPGDYIIDVDGNNVCGAPETDITAWLKGQAGTPVVLTVLRGDEIFQVVAIRDRVVFPTVELEKIENGVAWITCSAFGSTTCQHFYDIISACDDEVEQWVVDLRGNGGGDLYAAVYSAGLFAGNGYGVYLRHGTDDYYRCLYNVDALVSSDYCDADRSRFYRDGYLTEDPVYVLTDASSASAAELFCSVIRDSGAGLIVGDRTYGKGVAQTLLTGERYGLVDGDALKITSERAYAMSGATYDKIGILPHILVDPDLADEAAAVLAAPFDEIEDILILTNISADSTLVDDLGVPLSVLSDPEYSVVVGQILSALPSGVSCQFRQGGLFTRMTVEEVAQYCGVTLQRTDFSDTGDALYRDRIKDLAMYGVVDGNGNGTFRPETALNRAAMCALLVKALRFPISETPQTTVFSDVPANAWYAPYVNAMYEAGMINGYTDGKFHPQDPVTCEQFLALLGRAAKWLNMDYYELSRHEGIYGDVLPDSGELKELYGNWSAWARELIWLCDADLLWEPLETIDPAAVITRGEAAAAVFNLLYESGILPG